MGAADRTSVMTSAGLPGDVLAVGSQTHETWDGRNVSFPPLRPGPERSSEPDETAVGMMSDPDDPMASPVPALAVESVQTALTRTCRGRFPEAHVLAVTGARGGLGASVLLLHLAWALSRAGLRVAMMDLDPAGGLDLLCGESVLTGLRWADLPAEESSFRPGRLVGALPVWHAMPLLTSDVRGGPMSCAGAVLEAMSAEHDIVLVDLPRGAPPPPGSSVLLLSGLDLRSAVAAESVAPQLRGPAPDDVVGPAGPGSPVWLVVRQMGEDVVPEDLELITGCPVLGRVPNDRVLARRLALGEDPVRSRSAIRRAATALARELLDRVLVPEAPEPVPVSTQQIGERAKEQSPERAAGRGSVPWTR